MNKTVTRIDIPEGHAAVFSQSGEVFYSLPRLLESFKGMVEEATNTVKNTDYATIDKASFDAGVAFGLTLILSTIEENNELLYLEGVTGIV